MTRWTELTAEYKQQNDEILTQDQRQKGEDRSKRLHRVFKSIVVPGMGGIIVLILGVTTTNWGYSRVQENLQTRKADKLKKEQEDKLKQLESKVSKADKSAKEILYNAYHKEQEKERKEKAKLEAIQKAKELKKKSLAESRNEFQKISKEIQLSIQQKEFADQKIVLAAEALDHAKKEFDIVENSRIQLERKMKARVWNQKNSEQEIELLREKRDKADQAVNAILKEKEQLEKESISLAENENGVDKEKLLDAIKKIEKIDLKLQDAIKNFNFINEKIGLVGGGGLSAEKLEADIDAKLTKVKAEALKAGKDRDEAINELIIARNNKTSIERDILKKIQKRHQIELKEMKDLRKNGKRAMLQKATQKSAQFYSEIHYSLKKLQFEEGMEWLRRAKSLLSSKESFPGKLMLARILGFRGPKIIENQEGLKFRQGYETLFSLKNKELKEIDDLLGSGPNFYPVWKTPVSSDTSHLISVAFSPDGRVFCSAEGNQIKLRFLQEENITPVVLEHFGVTEISFSPDGKLLATASENSSVKVWDYKTQELVRLIDGHQDAITSLSFNDDGTKLATASRDLTIKVWDIVQVDAVPITLVCDSFIPQTLKFGHSGQHLFSNGEDSTIALWDLNTGGIKKLFSGHNALVTGLDINSSNGMLISSSLDSTARLWDIHSENNFRSLNYASQPVSNAQFSPNGKLIATMHGQTVQIWDANSKAILGVINGPSSSVTDISFSPDSSILATATLNEIHFWAIKEAVEAEPKDQNLGIVDKDDGRKIFEGHSSAVIGLCFSNDSRFMASAGRDKTIKVWEISTGWDMLTLKGHEGAIWDVRFSQDDSKIISAGADSKIKVWDSMTGDAMSTVSVHSGAVYSLSCSPDGKTVASGSKDATVKLWNLATGKVRLSLLGHEDTVISVCFSPDGKKLASSSKDGTIKIWDLRTGLEIFTLKGHSGAVFDVKFSTDGLYIVSSGKDKTIKLWDAIFGTEVLTFSGHEGIVYCIGISPDGQTMASASKDGMVKIWDLVSGNELSTIKSESPSVFNVSYSQDGNYLAVGNGDSTITLLPVDHTDSFDYLSYLSLVKVENFHYTWIPISQASPFINIPKHSFLEILRSGFSEEETIDKLFWRYANSGGWPGTISLFNELSETIKEKAQKVIAEKLKWKTKYALDRGYFGLANQRMNQFSKVSDSALENQEMQYLDIRNKYLKISVEARSNNREKEEHKDYASCIAHLKQLLDSGWEKSALELANDFSVDIFSSIPSKQNDFDKISASEWIENAEKYHAIDYLKAVTFCLQAIARDEQFVASYQAPVDRPWIEYILACAYAHQAGLGSNTGQQENSNRTVNISRAMDRLKRAREKGWQDWERMKSERFFDGIRSDPVYQEYTASQ